MGVKENRSGEACALRKDIGAFIRKIRLKQSLTGSQLGELLNVSQQQISRYEKGVTSMPIEILGKVLDVLGSNWIEFYYNVLLKDEGSHHLKSASKYPFYFK